MPDASAYNFSLRLMQSISMQINCAQDRNFGVFFQVKKKKDVTVFYLCSLKME